MIILSGGDDSRMKNIIEKALTEAGEPYTLNEDESDTLTAEQAASMMVYNASKVRTYLGRLERNTRKQEEDLRRQEDRLREITFLLEPISVYFESQLARDTPREPRRSDITSRLTTVRTKRWREEKDAETRAKQEESS